MNICDDQSQHFQPRSPALATLLMRGFINQATDLAAIDAALEAGPVSIYVGFDATADSLHVGHLLPIMMLRRLQQDGYKPIVLIGGGTTLIGDPSFRSEARPMLTKDEIAANINSLAKVFERFLTFGEGRNDAVLINNADWLADLRWIDVLRDVGRHFSVNRMLSFDSVKMRLERQQTLSFLEFNYMLLQSVDFLELFRRMGCLLQIGGADQWGNIVNGVDLIRRSEGAVAFGLTAPLLTTASGAKMGKTAAGAVWLNPERLSPYDYWQFWRNSQDGDVARFLDLFTELQQEEISMLTQSDGVALNAAKQRLANEATKLAHGMEAAQNAAAMAAQIFGEGETAEGLPSFVTPHAQRQEGLALVDLLVEAGLCVSKSEARRVIAGRGVRINGDIVEDSARLILSSELPLRLSLGRKRHVMVQ